ncbi:MAG: CoA-binding protein, partial [Candidatus Eisenbacteria bacterium]|nr:CoA-binding protein [Candidatus Eisenbacteria bacterium]
MDVHGLDTIFRPQRIAVFGASENPKGVGTTVLRNLVSGGFRGVVYPVHKTMEAALGIPCFPEVKGLPKVPDLAVICTAATAVPGIVAECGEAGIRGVVILSAGFKEVGPEGKALEDAVRAEQSRFDGMRIIGPNCLGIIVPGLALNASFATEMPKAGHVAFLSQSGALCTSVLDWAAEENVGFSYFVSIGNMLDVDFGDLIDYFGADEKTKSVILYVESLKNPRKFMTATRAFARVKPILAYKAGRFAESAKAAASHTGALAGEDSVYDAAFERSGIARVFEIGDVFDCAELVARYQQPRGARLAIVTNAGGPGVMATDALIARKGVLAELSEETIRQLDETMPPFWSHAVSYTHLRAHETALCISFS